MTIRRRFVAAHRAPIITAGFGTLLLLGALLAHAPLAHADVTWNVTPSSSCSLSEAMNASLEGGGYTGPCTPGDSGNDTIHLAAGTYTLGASLAGIGNQLNIVGSGPGSTIIDGQNLYQVFYQDGASFNVSDLTIDHAGAGGGADAAIHSTNGNINNVVIENSAVNGIVMGTGPSGNVSLTNTAVINSAGTGAGVAMDGGGGTETVNNLTVEGNTGGAGGLMLVDNSTTTVNITNVTIANNTSTGYEAGLTVANFGGSSTVNIENSILSNNRKSGVADNCGSGPGSGGATLLLPTSQGHNISSDGTCGFTGTSNLSNTDPQLGSLTLVNGTYVMPITDSSPAYASAYTPAAPSTDQRGVTRPQCTVADIGAYETTTCAPSSGGGSGNTTDNTSSGSSSGSGNGASSAKKTGTSSAAASSTGTTSSGSSAPTTSQSTSGKQAGGATKSVAAKPAKHASSLAAIWIGLAIILVGVGAGGWFYMSKNPKKLAKLRRKLHL